MPIVSPAPTLSAHLVRGRPILAVCLAIGLLAGLAERHDMFGPGTRLFLFSGLLGGFTTFSAFSMEFWALFDRGQSAQAFAYVAASVIGAIAACGIGLLMIRQVSA